MLRVPPVAALVVLAVLVPVPASAAPTLRLGADSVDISTVDGVELEAEGSSPGSDLGFLVEAGRVEPLPPRDGRVRARWILPRELEPRRLAAAVVDADTGEAAFAVLAVSRRAKLHVTGSPRAQVRLRLGGVVVAEGRADAAGHLELGMLVPPAVDLAAVEQERGEESDAVRKVEQLHVRNELHVFAVATTAAGAAAGSASLLALAYRDDGGTRAGTLDIRAGPHVRTATKTLRPGLFQVDLRAAARPEHPLPDVLAVELEARDGAMVGKGTVTVALAREATPEAARESASVTPARRSSLRLALYGAYGGDGGTVSAAGPLAVLAWNPSFAPTSLWAVLEAGGSFSWSEQSSNPNGKGRYTRYRLLVPASVGAELRTSLGSSASLGVGAGSGVLLARIQSAVRTGNVEVRSSSLDTGVAWLWRADGRLGYRIGPGELSVQLEGWATVLASSSFVERPRAASVGLGYDLPL